MANNDLLLAFIVFSIFILIVNRKQWIRLLNTYYLKIAVFAFLQMFNPAFSDVKHSVSVLTAFVGIVYTFALPIGIAYLIKTGKLKNEQFRKDYGAFYESYKEDSFKTAAFEVVVLIKKFLIAISIVFFYGSPAFQLITIIIY